MRRTGIRAGQRLARLAVTGLVGVAVLAGCSAEGQQASTELPPASSTSPQPTPELPPLGPAEFPVPDEARVQDEAGAEAFLRYYIELLNRQRALPDGKPLRDLGPDCAGCLRIASNYDDVARAGHRYSGGELTLNDVPAARLDGGEARIAFGIRQEAVSITDSRGAVVNQGLPAIDNAGSGIALRWSQEHASWLVTALDLG